MKKLVIYYSLDGNTRFIAEKMAEKIDADILELKPEKEIPRIEPMKHFFGAKKVLLKRTSELKEYSLNLKDYDLSAIGTPVWAFTYTPAIRTFLSENDISDKKIILFCTSMIGPGKTFADFKKALENNEIIGEIGFKKVLKKPLENLEHLENFIDSIKDKI